MLPLGGLEGFPLSLQPEIAKYVWPKGPVLHSSGKFLQISDGRDIGSKKAQPNTQTTL